MALAVGLALAGVLLAPAPAAAQRIENGVAIFAALDKVTAKISRLEVPLNQTANFGSLQVTPRACYSRSPTEPPKTTGFVEVDETLLEEKHKRIFTGWMFAESPGINAVEHPVFDVWLTDCTSPQRTVAAPKAAPQPGAGQAVGELPPADADTPRRRRVPR